MKKHRWEHKDKANSRCIQCGLNRFKEFAYGYHFYIFWFDGGDEETTLNNNKIPECKN